MMCIGTCSTTPLCYEQPTSCVVTAAPMRQFKSNTLLTPEEFSWTGSLSYSLYSYKKRKRKEGEMCLETDMSPAGMLNLLALPEKAAALTTKV